MKILKEKKNSILTAGAKGAMAPPLANWLSHQIHIHRLPTFAFGPSPLTILHPCTDIVMDLGVLPCIS